jgi:TetR/AcrR family tetracycline transcriptional repressor
VGDAAVLDHPRSAGRTGAAGAGQARDSVVDVDVDVIEPPLDIVQYLDIVQILYAVLGRAKGTGTERVVTTVKRGRGPRRALSEDEFLDAALGLLDEGGQNAASVRGIAARVGVAPNAVYTYFPDKAAVFRALVDRLLGEVDHGVFADREQPWRQRVESLALELRAVLAAHPGVTALMIGEPMNGPHALALNERLLELLADAGLNPADAARAAYLLIVYVFGSMALEVADLGPQASPLPPDSERVANRQDAFAATPTDKFPRSTTAAGAMTDYVSTEQYVWGLHRILDGITATRPKRGDDGL